MVDTKKEQERDELHRAIWAIADELRGAVDGWDFKNYVLGMMFYRYISENLSDYITCGERAAGDTGFDYVTMPDEDAEGAREGLVQEKGFFILPSELFCNVCARAKDDENLNETLETVFRHIEESAKGSESESDFEGLFDDFDVNSNKLGATVAKRNEKLVKLLSGVAEMNLGDVKGHDIDAFGDAYEYLMTMYASNAGKSGGEFFTPADVSELLTRLGTVGKTEINKVYEDKEVLISIRKAIDASPELRSKKDLIENFIAGVNESGDILNEWNGYVAEKREEDLSAIIQGERLKEDDTRRYMENAFRDGEIKTAGTDIDALLPPISRFGSGTRAKKKQSVIDKFKGFFERYFGIGGAPSFEKPKAAMPYGGKEKMSVAAERPMTYGR